MDEVCPASLINDAQFVDEDVAKVMLFRICDPLAKELSDCFGCLHCTGIIAALLVPARSVIPTAHDAAFGEPEPPAPFTKSTAHLLAGRLVAPVERLIMQKLRTT